MQAVAGREQRIERRGERSQNSRSDRKRKDRLPPHDIEERHGRRQCACPLPVDRAEERKRSRCDQRGRRRSAENGPLRIPSDIHEDGRRQYGIEPRIDDPSAQSVSRKVRIRERGRSAVAEYKEEQERNEDEVDAGDPLGPARQDPRGEDKPAHGEKRRTGRQERVKAGEHPRTGDKGDRRKDPLKEMRRPPEERGKRTPVAVIPLPEREKICGEHKKDEHGDGERRKKPLRTEETNELRSRNKSRTDHRPHDHRNGPNILHIFLCMRIRAEFMKKIRKKPKLCQT